MGSRPLSGHGPADQVAAVGSPMADDRQISSEDQRSDAPYMSRQSFTQPSLRLGALGSLPSRAEKSRGRESV